jgi:(p)ppGpp synthase/HD superfamily hydrolase
MDPLTSAKSYATLHHVVRKGQMYGVLPYTHHLASVEGVLREFGEERTEMLVAAWLHDIIEDTDVKARDVEENFGEEVARLVSAVTSEPGPNRKTKVALTLPKTREAGNDAVRLKLADRIANVRNGGSSVEMYRKEHDNFRHALYSQGSGNGPMWEELDFLLERK